MPASGPPSPEGLAAGGPGPRMFSLTREDVRDEIRTILSLAFQRQIREFSDGIQRDARDEFRRFMDSTSREPCSLHGHSEVQRSKADMPASRTAASGEWVHELDLPTAEAPPILSQFRAELGKSAFQDQTAAPVEALRVVAEVRSPPSFAGYAMPRAPFCHTGVSRRSEYGGGGHLNLPGVIRDSWEPLDVDATMHAMDTQLPQKRNSEDAKTPSSNGPGDGAQMGDQRSCPMGARQVLASKPIRGAGHKSWEQPPHVLAHSRMTVGQVLGTGRRGACFNFCHVLVSNLRFDYFISLFLVMNAISLGINVNYMATRKADETPRIFRVLGFSFCIVYTVELFLRIFVLRRKFLWSKTWRCHTFDVVVLVFAWANEVEELLVHFTVQNSIWAAGLLRLLSLGRLARFARLVRLIPELRSIAKIVFVSMASFFWAFALLIILLYCVAVYFTEVAADALKLSQMDAMALASIAVRWGSLWQSVLSLYMAISGGDDWRNLVDPFRSDSPWQYTTNICVFAIYIAFATLVIMNVITGILVEGAQRMIRDANDNALINVSANLFLAGEPDDSANITFDEFSKKLDSGNLDGYIKVLGINRAEAMQLFDFVDRDGSGTISVAEFVKGCLRLRGPATAMDLTAMLYSVRQLSRETHGLILDVKAALSRMSEELGESSRAVSLQGVRLAAYQALHKERPRPPATLEEVLV